MPPFLVARTHARPAVDARLLRASMLLAAPEAIYTHPNISNGFFNSTYVMTSTPDPSTVPQNAQAC